MRVAIEELSLKLQACVADSLPKIILINSHEPLLVEEALDEVRNTVKKLGFNERIKYQAEAGFDWSSLTGVGQAMSLFAERRLLELRVPKSLGSPGTKALLEYCNNLPQDDVLVILMPLLDKRQRAAKWFKTLDAIAWIADGYEISGAQFQRWVKQRFQSRALRLEAGVAEMLAEQTEGNLLAAAQEVDKLQVLAVDGAVTMALLEQSLADQTRFDVYALSDAALAGDFARVVRIKNRLATEEVEAVIVVWSLVREIRTLTAISMAEQAGQNRAQLFKEHRIWSKREPLFKAALGRLSAIDCAAALEQAAYLDQTVKGQRYREVGDIWYQIEQLCAVLCQIPACSVRAIS